MQRREAIWGALPEVPVCGRPEGHNGEHRTVMGVRRKQEADMARLSRRRRSRRLHARLASVVGLAAAQAGERSRAA
jgi:hypothetical protein